VTGKILHQTLIEVLPPRDLKRWTQQGGSRDIFPAAREHQTLSAGSCKDRYCFCDLEIIPCPRTVLIKRLADQTWLQLVSGSGEEQNHANEPKRHVEIY